jgi:hypothetical protein
MLARFENGNFLEVRVAEDDNTKEYDFYVYDENGCEVAAGWTEYRDLSMYPDKNEIDYILYMCEPKCISGKYELLEQKDMDEYLEKYGEDPNGEWILERQGTEYDDIRYFKTEEAAQYNMNVEVTSCDKCYKSFDLNYCEVNEDEYFQSWTVYKKQIFDSDIENVFHEIELQFDRIYTGVSQYAYELEDTSVITEHVAELKRMINELKEMI